MSVVEKTLLYPAKYGAWAGNPAGIKPDYSRCCQQVWSSERWSRASQCLRKRGHGPDGAYCRQHDPVVAEARRKAAEAASEKRWNDRLIEVYGRRFFNVLVQIADGHNDARGLAQEAVDEFRKKRCANKRFAL